VKDIIIILFRRYATTISDCISKRIVKIGQRKPKILQE